MAFLEISAITTIVSIQYNDKASLGFKPILT